MKKSVIVVGIILAGIWAGVTFISFGVPVYVCDFLKSIAPAVLDGAIGNMQYGFYYDVPNRDMPTVIFLTLFSTAFIIYFFLSMKLMKVRAGKNVFFIILFFAFIFRLILLPGIAIHENDFYRYLWDGKVFKSGINPFKYAPGDIDSFKKKLSFPRMRESKSPGVIDSRFPLAGRLRTRGNDNGNGNDRIDTGEIIKTRTFSPEEEREIRRLDELRMENPVFFKRIGHQWVPTIYPPLTQLIFVLSSIIKSDSILVIKSIFVIFDMLVILVIAKILSLLNRDPCHSIIYAWSPLVLKEVPNSGHYDSIPVFFMLAAILFFLNKRSFKGAVSMALAAASKLFPLVLVPLYARMIKLKRFLMFALIFIMLHVPFFLWGNAGTAQVFKGLRIYSGRWAYNGSIFVLIESFFNAIGLELFNNSLFLPKLVSGGIFLGAIAYLSFDKKKDELTLLHKSFVAVALLFLLNPVGDPWYFCWVIPFLCIFPYIPFIILSWLLIFSYLSFNHDFGVFSIGSFSLPVLNIIQYVPFMILVIAGNIKKKTRKMTCHV